MTRENAAKVQEAHIGVSGTKKGSIAKNRSTVQALDTGDHMSFYHSSNSLTRNSSQ